MSNVLKEYYPVICPEYTICYYGLDENIRLFEKIKQKYLSQEYELFKSVREQLQKIFLESEFYLMEDEMPSITLVIKNMEEYEDTEVYFSISLLAKCYCFFIKRKEYYGDTYYFDPFFELTELYNRIDEPLKIILKDYINVPYIILRFALRNIIPGVNQTNQDTGEPVYPARIFDALFYKYDFSLAGSSVMHRSSIDYEIFKKLERSDPDLLERFNFFKKEKKSELKLI